MPRFRVVLEEGGQEREEIVPVEARDLITYEAEFDTSYVTSEASLTQDCQVVFCAMRRTGLFVGDWAKFASQVLMSKEIKGEQSGELDPERPTQPAPEDGP